MPVAPTYPGVYIQELESGVRPISGVATSITAFIGRAYRGPLNEAQTINNFGDYERLFGGIWEGSTMSYAVRDFFLNGGGKAIIVRVFEPSIPEADRLGLWDLAKTNAEKAAKAVGKAVTDGAVANLTAVELVEKAVTVASGYLSPQTAEFAAANDMLSQIRRAAGRRATFDEVMAATKVVTTRISDDAPKIAKAAEDVATEIAAKLATTPGDPDAALAAGRGKVPAAEPGKDAGNLVVKAAEDKKPNAAQMADAAKDAAAAISALHQKASDRVSEIVASIDKLPQSNIEDLVRSIAEAVALKVVSDGSLKDLLEPINVAASARAEAGPDASVVIAVATVPASVDAATRAGQSAVAPVTIAKLKGGGLELQAKYPGSWGNKLQMRIDLNTADPQDTTIFNLHVRDANTESVETFLGVSTDLGSNRYVLSVLQNESSLVEATSVLAEITAHEEPDVTMREAFAAHAGSRFSIVLPENFASDGKAPSEPVLMGDQTKKTGMFALEKADQFNLLCIPPSEQGENVPPGVIVAATQYCNDRRAIYIMDPPKEWKTKDLAKEGMKGVDRHPNKVLYWPRIKQRNPKHENRIEEFVPCGAIAGVIARTDASRGVWKAPAGLDATLVGVAELSANITDAENGELNPLALNCLRVREPSGKVVWGARTLMGDDRLANQWKYLPIRRTALYIEESLYRGMQWVVFEPNDEPLWAQIRLNVGSFMHQLFRQGAFEGASPKDAYLVKCDSETTSATDRALGVVNILVGFAPLKPAEFVIISLQQMTRKEGG